MALYLGLGSNLGDRRAHLEQAAAGLAAAGFTIEAVSPVVETPALLPPDAESAWNRPYLNCVLAGTADWDPEAALAVIRRLEDAAGRARGAHWAPRPLDIDILAWGGRTVDRPDLVIPHRELAARPFVLTPLAHLAPALVLPGQSETVLALARAAGTVPLWMGIVNLTPDSFSDGGEREDRAALERTITEWVEANVPMIDLGAESTRPGAEPVDPDTEWRRLAPAFEAFAAATRGRRIRPWLGIDSRHPATVARALAAGADLVNDVGGLADPAMQALVRDAGCQAVAMHSVTVPVARGRVLDPGQSAVAQVQRWLAERRRDWEAAGLDPARLIVDPGIGFGKTPLQSLELLRRAGEIAGLDLRLLVGHSRKSFMDGFCEAPFAGRDPETAGISLALAGQGVEILRVHDPLLHQRTWRAWAHVAGAAPAGVSGISPRRSG